MQICISTLLAMAIFCTTIRGKSKLQEEMEQVAQANKLHHLVSDAQPLSFGTQKQMGAKNILKCAEHFEKSGIDRHTAFLYANALNASSRYTLFASPEEAPEAYALAQKVSVALETAPPKAIFFSYDATLSSQASGMHVILAYNQIKQIEDPTEQEALIAHEVEHLAQEHSRKHIELLARAATTQHELMHATREYELEADAGAARVSGSEAIIEVLKKIVVPCAQEGENPSDEWLAMAESHSTHPCRETRIRAIEKLREQKFSINQ